MRTIQARSLQVSTLGFITALALLGCSGQSTNIAVSSNTTISTAVASSNTKVAAEPSSRSKQLEEETSSDPASVVDRFYNGYIFEQTPWQELEDYIDRDTYQQLSELKAYDSDPFTNSQESLYDYLIGESRVIDDRAEVEIRFKTRIGSREPSPEFGRPIAIVLQDNNGQWQIQNIIYSPEADPSGEPNDLLHGWMETQRNFYPNIQR